MVGDPSGFSTLLSRSDILRNVLGLAAAGGSFRGGAAIAQIGYPALPPLTGRYDTIGCRYTRVNGYATQGRARTSRLQTGLLLTLLLTFESRLGQRACQDLLPGERPLEHGGSLLHRRPRHLGRDGGTGRVPQRARNALAYSGAWTRAPCRLPDVADPTAFGRAGSASSGSPFCSATSPTRPRAAGSRRHHSARRARCRSSATRTALAATWTWRRTSCARSHLTARRSASNPNPNPDPDPSPS